MRSNTKSPQVVKINHNNPAQKRKKDISKSRQRIIQMKNTILVAQKRPENNKINIHKNNTKIIIRLIIKVISPQIRKEKRHWFKR